MPLLKLLNSEDGEHTPYRHMYVVRVVRLREILADNNSTYMYKYTHTPLYAHVCKHEHSTHRCKHIHMCTCTRTPQAPCTGPRAEMGASRLQDTAKRVCSESHIEA